MTNPIRNRNGIFRLPDEDNVHIGTLAAEHFLSLGRFRSFGFVPDVDDHLWSRQRLEGFRRGLGRDARRLEVFKHPAESHSDASSLTEWLLALPKPTAVMASWDYRAAEVVSACRNAGLSVPAQVAVCGMDDDEFICDSATPTLTSIRADRDGQGHAAATVLDAIMDGARHPKLNSDPFHTASIVVRGSSAHIAPATSLVERALVLVEQQALSGISATDIAKRLGISRRLLDMRFRQFGLPSVAEELTEHRLRKAKQLLAETLLPLDRIANLSGFANSDSMRNLFRHRFGLSTRAFRKARQSAAYHDPRFDIPAFQFDSRHCTTP
jgi:LacI family transcriptional regulator